MRFLSARVKPARRGDSWQYRPTVEYDDGVQRRLSISVIAKSEREADRLYEEEKRKLLMVGDEEFRATNLTVGEYLEDYLERGKPNWSPKTYRGYRDIVDNRIDPYIGSRRLSALRAEEVERMYDELLKNGRRGGGSLSKTTVGKVQSFLKTALSHAVDLELIKRNPCENIRQFPCDTEEMHILDEEGYCRMRKIMLGCPNKRLATATILALATGLRRGELCALRWRDVDLDRATLSVNGSLTEVTAADSPDGKDLLRKKPKTKRSARSVSLDDDTVAYLRRVKEEQAATLAYYDGEQTDETPVLAGNLGEWYRPGKLSTDFIQFAKGHGFDNFTFHDCRHTACSMLLNMGEDIITVSRRMGHESPTTTLRIYGHLLPGADRSAANKMARLHEKSQVGSIENETERASGSVSSVPHGTSRSVSYEKRGSLAS